MVTRVTGLMSGLDTETLVKQMMALSQAKYDNIMKKKVETEWKKDMYNDIYKQMSALDKKFYEFSLSAQNNPKIATSTNESIVTVKASSTATTVTHTLEVLSLATSASMISSDKISGNRDKSTLESQLALASGDDMEITLSDGNRDVSFTIGAGESIVDLVSKINSSGLGIKASYDSNTDRLFINSTTTGADSQIKITADNSAGQDLLAALKLQQPDGSYEKNGQNAVFKLDGVTLEQSSNEFEISGLAYSLKSAAPGQIISVGVKADNSKLVANIKDLIDTYNSLIDVLNTKATEKYYRDYDPLTDAQKKEMTEKEIALWEEKAKSGILRNDNLLSGLASKMRVTMFSSYNVDGKYKTLGSIGISTTNYQDKGKLTINEEKLMKALEEDPEAVQKLFGGATDGIIAKMRSEITSATRNMERKAGVGKTYDTESSWAKELSRYNKQMDTLSAKMVEEENRYYTQFANLEKLISQMNSNSSYITSLLGSQ